ncbi:hypothetical protein [Thermococcus sp. JdF3]|uniref:hypothetical protein n=1 Tax=Thermococcus sp. JdF3 TaxID=1638258 RepID=UPI001438EEB9|nr:hypothetical protein [Thermococcus sp. JdF3]NJE01464.1 hypothetical protein [Thermococcus sp. JdF3]
MLAVLVANHLGKEHEDIGWAIGDAIYDYLVMKNKSIEEVEKRPSEFAKLVVKKLQEREILGPSVAKSTERAIKEAIPPTIKLINKMWPKDHDVKHLRAMEEAFSPDIKDPLRTLKAAGIDVTKEVEELRNAIAEITGKKPKARGAPPGGSRKRAKSKRPVSSAGLPPELLAIVKALEFSDFSERAMEKAEKELLRLVDGLLEDEANAPQLFHAVKLLRLVQKGDIKGIKKLGG